MRTFSRSNGFSRETQEATCGMKNYGDDILQSEFERFTYPNREASAENGIEAVKISLRKLLKCKDG